MRGQEGAGENRGEADENQITGNTHDKTSRTQLFEESINLSLGQDLPSLQTTGPAVYRRLSH